MLKNMTVRYENGTPGLLACAIRMLMETPQALIFFTDFLKEIEDAPEKMAADAIDFATQLMEKHGDIRIHVDPESQGALAFPMQHDVTPETWEAMTDKEKAQCLFLSCFSYSPL